MSEISVPLSPGELADKITILQIKSERIDSAAKLENVNRELTLLIGVWQSSSYAIDTVSAQMNELKSINEELWDIEDAIRVKEKSAEFDEEFIRLARAVYVTNDKRAAVKKNINTALGSVLVEEKSYEDYS